MVHTKDNQDNLLQPQDKTSSIAITDGVKVIARPIYIPERSDASRSYYYFSYEISIENMREDPIRLLSRHWIIIDSDGVRSEVKGPGVVGETPLIRPGETYTYTSYCPLTTDFGTMEGTYQMIDGKGNPFTVKIGRFYLATNAEESNHYGK
ncbi:MAG: Co2+/Mg2+ efflux protein ApaG [Candidatus Hydrogenedentota bacterium]|nr:MAG: Co2+/Mg2+ efflux protein ApaG [Candidatus Hydrogenedentota bacterium]